MKHGPFARVVSLQFAGSGCAICRVRLKGTGGPVGYGDYYKRANLLAAYEETGGVEALDKTPLLTPTPEPLEEFQKDGTPYIVLNATSEDEIRDWPRERWAEAISDAREGRTFGVVEVGLKAGPPLFPGQPWYIDLRGKTSIRRLVSVIKRSSLFCGIDSGPAHIANAVDVRGVILLAEYLNFGQYMPYSGKYANGGAAILRKKTTGEHERGLVADAIRCMFPATWETETSKPNGL
jgi:heptosyltransferase-3